MCGELAHLPPRRCPWPPVHPRVCGELRVVAHLGGRHRRFIPACAGNSRWLFGTASLPIGSSPRVRGTRTPAAPPRRSAAVHPRVCGELSRHRCCSNGSGGSSPRVRGTRAYLGKYLSKPAVHPRVCGELPRNLHTGTTNTGSSPRVRGTPHRRHLRPPRRRFIPACAGNSRGVPGVRDELDGSSPRVRGTPGRGGPRPPPPPVHPRVCGELLPPV